MPHDPKRIPAHHVLIALGLVAVAYGILVAMGRPPICTCGYVKLWHGAVVSSENSQHLSDWYSITHVVHGLLFYAGVALLFGRRLSAGARFSLAVAVEALWEVVENTDYVINRYREATISLDYFGDSALNSASDIGFMIAGYLLAHRLPVGAALALAIALELFAGLLIRDNLTLNIIMLLHPVDAIKAWQSGLG